MPPVGKRRAKSARAHGDHRRPGNRRQVLVRFASPPNHAGYELITAGMLILAGGGRRMPLDYDRAGAEPGRLRAGDEVTQGRTLRSALSYVFVNF